MSDVPNINDMLKLYTKKELWERIQHHIKKMDDLQHQLNHQKAMWNKLKEWVEDDIELDYNSKAEVLVLNKMQELEKGEKDE